MRISGIRGVAIFISLTVLAHHAWSRHTEFLEEGWDA